MKVLYASLMLFILFTQPLFAQQYEEIENARNWRYSRINIQHIGIGVEVDAHSNINASSKLFYGIGSHRNLFNVDIGCKYTFNNPINSNNSDIISSQYFGIFAMGQLNLIRWYNTGCIYLGIGIEYNFAVTSSYKQPLLSTLTRDKNIGKNHSVTIVKIGVKLNYWDIYLYVDYNLAPATNQKYVFESNNFNFDNVYNQLYERYRIGISLSYLIPF